MAGAAAKALALGLAIGTIPLNDGAMSTTIAADPRLRATSTAGISAGKSCGVRVTLVGGSSCGGDGAPCEGEAVLRRAHRVQAFLGMVPREAGISRATSSSEWRETLNFGCVDGRDPLVLTVFDNLTRSLATCETEHADQLWSGDERRCHGARGFYFDYVVEHDDGPPQSAGISRAARVLQSENTPSPASVEESDEAEETVAPAADDDTTDTTFVTPEPTSAATSESTPEPTPAPVTSRPVTVTAPPTTAEPTTAPVSTTARPVTVTEEPTPAPASVTPEPTPAPVTPEPTPAPVTPEPTPAPVGTPPTASPVAAPVAVPTSPPTSEPTTNPIAPTPEPTPSPVSIGTDNPTAQPVAAPVSSATESPTRRSAPVATSNPVTPPTAPPSTVPIAIPTTKPPTSAPAPTFIGTSTAAPVRPSPAPTPKPVTPPPTLKPTSNPVSPPVSASPTARPTSKPSPVPPTSPPTAEPTQLIRVPTPSPEPPPSVSPVGYPALTTPSPSSPTPLLLPQPPAPSSSASAASDTSTDAPVSPPTAAPVARSVTGAPAIASTSPPTAAPMTAAAPTSAPVSVAVTPSPTLGSTGTSAPVATAAATLSPASADLCTDACVNLQTDSEWSGSYLDYRCNGEMELPGCNLDGAATNCRRCLISTDKYEAENGADAVAWLECPCCVAEALGRDPQTDVCEAELGGETPAPSSTSETAIDLTTSANDPQLMMLSFNSDDCTASGIAIIEDSSGSRRVLEVSRYTDSEGNCGESFEVIHGSECEADDLTYEWEYTDSFFSYTYTCEGGTTSARRRLEGDAVRTDLSSATVLCNNGDTFMSLANLEGDEEGLVYATEDAEGFIGVTETVDSKGGDPYCNEDATAATSAVLASGVDNVLEFPDSSSSGGDSFNYYIIAAVAAAVVLLMLCGCFCCYRHRKGKEGRADRMRRNLGYTPDMEAKGEGNFGPTNKHVAITRGGGPQVTPDMLATTSYRPTYGSHQRAPSEAPSSVIEDNIANNYRPKTAAKQWEKRKVHKEATMPASQQHVIGAGPTSEELKTENANSHSQSARSEQLSERSLTQLELSRNQSGAHPSAAQAQYGYAFDEVEEDEEDDDARSAATGMSGPSKYAPSGYAPSSHHGGVTHDMMSQYEPSVYEADSTYDQSLYGRESEYGDEASSYSYNQDARSSGRGGYGHHARGRSGGHNSVSGRASVADTAAMSHLGSVMEMDDGGDSNSAYAPSDSYVSSYVSSEDDDGRPARSIHPRGGIEDGRSPSSGGYSSRHNTHRSGRENMSGGRSGFGASSAGGSSSRHSGGRSGFEGDSRDLDEDDDSVMHNIPVSMDDQEYYSEDNPSARGAPLTDVDERHNGQRW